MELEEIKVGLIRSRHNLPVNEYIIDFEIEDPYEQYEEIKETIHKFLIQKVGITTINGYGVNQAGGNDVPCYFGEKELVVYVTGLTIVTAELINWCLIYGVNLTLMYYNSKTQEYFPQVITL